MKIDEKDICEMFGEDVVTEKVKQRIKDADLNYEILWGVEKENAVLDQLKRMKADKQVAGTAEREKTWEIGWKENLDMLRESDNVDALRPKYYKGGGVFRYQGQFIKCDNYFESRMQEICKLVVFEQYFGGYNNIYEFGCGCSYNLVDLAKIYPDKQLYGLDFVKPSVDIIDILREKFGYKIDGSIFDFKNPNYSIQIKPNSVVFTCTAMEQIGADWAPFLEYLLKQKPSVVVNVEPIIELYDENNIVDWLAKEFSMQRNYLNGYYPRLKELEENKQIKIEKVKRLGFGGFNHEAYTLIIWSCL